MSPELKKVIYGSIIAGVIYLLFIGVVAASIGGNPWNSDSYDPNGFYSLTSANIMCSIIGVLCGGFIGATFIN